MRTCDDRLADIGVPILVAEIARNEPAMTHSPQSRISTLPMTTLGLVAALLLQGCAGQLSLLEDGRRHPGTWSSATGRIDATIDGEQFSGSYFDPPNIGIGIGGWGGSWGGGGACVGVSTATGGGGGHAVLRSARGQVIECFFATSFGRGQGECRGMDGRRFVLVIGE